MFSVAGLALVVGWGQEDGALCLILHMPTTGQHRKPQRWGEHGGNGICKGRIWQRGRLRMEKQRRNSKWSGRPRVDIVWTSGCSDKGLAYSRKEARGCRLQNAVFTLTCFNKKPLCRRINVGIGCAGALQPRV